MCNVNIVCGDLSCWSRMGHRPHGDGTAWIARQGNHLPVSSLDGPCPEEVDPSSPTGRSPLRKVRPFAVAFLGHSLASDGEPECNFHVTHNPSGNSWGTRRRLETWRHLEAQLLEELHAKRNEAHRQSSCSSSAPPQHDSSEVSAGSPPGVLGCRSPSGRQSNGLLPRDAAAAQTGFFGRRRTSAAEVVRWQRELEMLQSKLAELLHVEDSWNSTTLQHFLGVCSPDIPTLVRIARMALELPSQTSVEAMLEVQPSEVFATKETDDPALTTHFVVKVVPMQGPAPASRQVTCLHEWPRDAPTRIPVGGLEPDVCYEFTVQAANAMGVSEGVRIPVITTPVPVAPKREEPELPKAPVTAAEPRASVVDELAVKEMPEVENLNVDLKLSDFAQVTTAGTGSSEDAVAEAPQEAVPASPAIGQAASGTSAGYATVQSSKAIAEQPEAPQSSQAKSSATAGPVERAPEAPAPVQNHRDPSLPVALQEPTKGAEPGNTVEWQREISKTSAGTCHSTSGQGAVVEDSAEAPRSEADAAETKINEVLAQTAVGGTASASTQASSARGEVHEGLRSAADASQAPDTGLPGVAAEPTSPIDVVAPAGPALTTTDTATSTTPGSAAKQATPGSPTPQPVAQPVAAAEVVRSVEKGDRTEPPEAISRATTTASEPAADVADRPLETAQQPPPKADLSADKTSTKAAQAGEPAEPGHGGTERLQPTAETIAEASLAAKETLLECSRAVVESTESSPKESVLVAPIAKEESKPVVAAAKAAEVVVERPAAAIVSADKEAAHKPEVGSPAKPEAVSIAAGAEVLKASSKEDAAIDAEQSTTCEALTEEAPDESPSATEDDLDSQLPVSPPPEPAAKKEEKVVLPPRPGYSRVVGFEVKTASLPPGADAPTIEALTLQYQAQLNADEKDQSALLSMQQALRLTLGSELKPDVAKQKCEAVRQWRKSNGMATVRTRLEALAASPASPAASMFPHAEKMSKLMVVNPCSVLTAEGWPVSIWHIGTLSSSAASKLQAEDLKTWSANVFEYVDVWLSGESERTQQLVGHVQIFDLNGMSMWHATNSALIEKLKTAFSAGEFYLEAVSHIYVINSSSVFSMAWRIIKGLISPRTTSKITVAPDVPAELLNAVGPASAKRLKDLLKARDPNMPVLRPRGLTR
eukprot:TRINITY_DN26215_c0_g2_i1.p1 TRINITY_DN26215_c0_g2~~TRINITY_DN26215_c0_g2_i1.p1  ORF type:complete len:1161 (+),score=247.08 TRINITY_DN26215_c0_g2_i1:35-3517(+)